MLVQQAYKFNRGLPRCIEVAERFARCFVGDVVISSITLRGLGGAPYQQVHITPTGGVIRPEAELHHPRVRAELPAYAAVGGRVAGATLPVA